MREPELFDVPVPGGTLRVARWPGRAGAPVAIGVHGITATHRCWSLVAEHLDADVTLLAPDLRGRGGSAGVGAPYGIARHADDLIEILDREAIASAVVAGHSMGGFVAALAAVRHPRRVDSALILDGGVKLVDAPPDADFDALLHQIIGPSLERLKATFASREAYRDFWRRHPAFEDFNEHVQAYVDYDLVGDEPALRSGVSLDAVYEDTKDTIADPDTVTAIERITQPATFVRATRGVMNQPAGLYDAATATRLQAAVPHMATDVIDASHFSMLLGEGAPAVADHVRKACGA